MREGMPLKLSPMEPKYWLEQSKVGKRIPNKIRRYWVGVK